MNLSGLFNFPGLSQPAPSNQPGQAAPVGTPQPGASELATQAASSALMKTDQADLSASGLAAAQNATLSGSASAAGSPNSDVRMSLVNSIQSAIQAGTYNVPASEVASSIMQSMMLQGG